MLKAIEFELNPADKDAAFVDRIALMQNGDVIYLEEGFTSERLCNIFNDENWFAILAEARFRIDGLWLAEHSEMEG